MYFTGQERDSESGLDKFMFREYSSQLGRWMHPDPAGLLTVDITDPQTWNRYSYVGNKPTGLTDPTGLCGGVTAGITSGPNKGGGRDLLIKAIELGFDVAYPFAGGNKLGGGMNVMFGTGQSNTIPIASAMIADVNAQSRQTGGGSFVGAWSGGAVTNARAGVLPSDRSYAQVLFSPGNTNLETNNPNLLVFSGSGFKDSLVNGTNYGGGPYPGTPGAGHDVARMMTGHNTEIDALLKGNAVQPCPVIHIYVPHGYSPSNFSFNRNFGALQFRADVNISCVTFSSSDGSHGNGATQCTVTVRYVPL
jgi:RHS repeat-associated protein